MGKCFIADVWMGVWATGDQTLSHPPEVQWPSECFPSQVFRLVWQSSSVCSQTPTLPRALVRAWKCSASVCLWFTNSEKIRGATASWPPDPSRDHSDSVNSSPISSHGQTTNGRTCFSLNLYIGDPVRGFWNKVTRKCQPQMSLQSRFASSFEPCRRLHRLTDQLQAEQNCAVFSASVTFLLDVSLFMTLLLQRLLWYWNHACSGFVQSLQIIGKRSENTENVVFRRE